MDQLTSASPGGDTLRFSLGAEELKSIHVNDIIVSDRGQGLLRRVVEIRQSGSEITLLTDPAAITDAIEQGGISFTRTLSVTDVRSFEPAAQGIELTAGRAGPESFDIRVPDVVIYDHDGNLATTWDQVRADGDITLKIDFAFQMSIEHFSLEHFLFQQTTDADSHLKLKSAIALVSLDAKHEIAQFRFSPITFWIGVVPVVFTPVLKVNVGARGKVSAQVEFEFTSHSQARYGLSCDAGSGWAPISEQSTTYEAVAPHLNLECRAQGYFGPQLELMLYGVAGPFMNAYLYGEAEVTPLEDPWWKLWGGVEVGGGAKLEIFSHLIANYEKPDIIQFRTLIMQASEPPVGTIRGLVRDAISNQPLAGARVTVYSGTQTVYWGDTDATGLYQFDLPTGSDYMMVVTKSGYLDVRYHGVRVDVGSETYLETILQIDEHHAGVGSVGGQIVNALSGVGLSGVRISVRSGLNQQTGPVARETVTGTNGMYSMVDLEAGQYTAEASLAGFVTSHFTLLCVGGVRIDYQNGTLTPVLPPEEYRIILTWDVLPWDLDSHLTGPLSDGSRFHLYFPLAEANGGSSWPDYALLDLDDTSSYGPETVTLKYQLPGIYRYSVHDFSNRLWTSSRALSGSNAQVRVYRGSELIRDFHVPADRDGTLWTVFEMEGDQIRSVNLMSYEDVSGDVTKRAAARRKAGP
jgi:hypothetical protein